MKYADIIYRVVELIRYAINILFTIALIIFLYGLTKYMLSAGDSSARQDAQKYIMYGVFGLFVLVSMWGLVSVLVNTFIPGGAAGIPQISL
jgi:cbb3-type cytochrome oxidase subunit 3